MAAHVTCRPGLTTEIKTLACHRPGHQSRSIPIGRGYSHHHGANSGEKNPYLHRDDGNKREKYPYSHVTVGIREKIPYLHRHDANNREKNH
jgi:hypothetical protein